MFQQKILESQSLKSNQVECNKVFWENFRCCVSIVIPKGHLVKGTLTFAKY